MLSRNPLQHFPPNENTFQSSKFSSISHKQSIQALPQAKRGRSSLDKQNIQCTFKPLTNVGGRKKRTLEKFVNDQENYQRAKELKIQQLRMEINRSEEEQHTGAPQIDRLSKQITASHRSSLRDNIFQRLSKQKSVSVAPEEYLFSPKILSRSKSIVRKSDVGSLLYEDAKRRQEKEQMMVQSSRKQIDLMMSPKINKNTNGLVLKRILTEFAELVTDEDINPLVALSILQEIFNVDLNPNKNQNNGQMVQKVIGILAEKESFGTLRAQKLKEFITIIVMGSAQGRYFSPEQQQFIIENFQFFYKERMTRERRSATPQKLTFRPKTLASSSKLAQSFREKTCQKLQNFLQNQKISIPPKEGGYTIQELFLIDYMKRQTEIQKKKIQRENMEMEQCTFKPDISESKSSINLIKKRPKVTLKAANRGKNIMKTEYTHLESQQCVGSSKIYCTISREQRQRRRRKRESEGLNMTQNVRDSEKAVLRMSIGRQKREFSLSVMNRGYPKDQNWASYHREMHQQNIENSKNLKGFTNK